MITRYRVSLNGVQLDSLHPAIIIHAVTEAAPGLTLQALQRPESSGTYLSMRKRTNKAVTVTFEVHERNLEERQRIMDAIFSWCDVGGVLEVSHRAGKELRVVCSKFPAVDVQKWTNKMAVTFTAYEVPYWQNTNAVTGTVANKSNASGVSTFEAAVNVVGTAETPLTVSVKNSGSSTVTSVSVTAGVYGGSTKTITLNGISLGAGQQLDITHDTSDRLQLKIGTQSVYSKLVATSDDDISLPPGDCFITASTTQASGIAVSYSYNARWL